MSDQYVVDKGHVHTKATVFFIHMIDVQAAYP